MFDISTLEKEKIIRDYVPTILDKSPVKHINTILDALKYNFKHDKTPDFKGKVFNIKVTLHNLSNTLQQIVIKTQYRSDTLFRIDCDETQLKLCNCKIHSKIIDIILPYQVRTIMNDMEMKKQIRYNDDEILFINPVGCLIPAIVIHSLYYYNNKIIPYMLHILNEKDINTGDFKSEYYKYYCVYNDINHSEVIKLKLEKERLKKQKLEKQKLEKEKLEKEKLEKQKHNNKKSDMKSTVKINTFKNTETDIIKNTETDIPIDIELTDVEKYKMNFMTQHQKQKFIKRKLYINKKIGDITKTKYRTKMETTKVILQKPTKKEHHFPNSYYKKPTQKAPTYKTNFWESDEDIEIGSILHGRKKKKKKGKKKKNDFSTTKIFNTISKPFSIASLSDHYH